MKESIFNIKFQVNGERYIYNSKTSGIISVESTDYDNTTIEYMKNNGYIVDDEFDEINAIVDETNCIIKSDFEDLNLTIIVTELCNFQCVYCYQNHNAKGLNLENAAKIVEVTKSMLLKKQYKKLSVHYFGGEPLLNSDMIFYLDSSFKKLSLDINIPYLSYITTNGSKLATSLLEQINFSEIQITIDGLEETHNKLRKSNCCSFVNLISIIETILPKCQKVIIRINLCQENKLDLIPLIDYILEHFKLFKDKIIFSINQMIKYNDNDNFTMLSLEEYASLNLIARLQLQRHGKMLRRPSRINYSCDFIYNKAYCINPDLSVGYCSGWGDLKKKEFSDNIVDVFPSLILKDKCKFCNILPLCLGGCKVKADLGYNECIPEKYIIKDLLINYINYMSNPS